VPGAVVGHPADSLVITSRSSVPGFRAYLSGHAARDGEPGEGGEPLPYVGSEQTLQREHWSSHPDNETAKRFTTFTTPTGGWVAQALRIACQKKPVPAGSVASPLVASTWGFATSAARSVPPRLAKSSGIRDQDVISVQKPLRLRDRAHSPLGGGHSGPHNNNIDILHLII